MAAAPLNIQSERLLLRPLTAADADTVFALRSHPQIALFTRRGRPETRPESDEWLKEHLESGYCLSYCVELRATTKENGIHEVDLGEDRNQRQVIGLTGAHRLPEVGYRYLPAYWGKGYATEALSTWIDWYWKTYPEGHEGNAYLKAVTGPEGANSRKVLQKCGFTWWCESQQEDRRKRENEDDGKKFVMLDTWRMEKAS